MPPLPLLADFVEFLSDNPQVVVIALVVIIGLIQGAARTVKKIMNQTGMAGQGGGLGGRDGDGRGTRRRERDPVLDVDPESLLPPMLRPRVWEEAKQAGVITEEEYPEVAAEPETRRRHILAQPAPAGARAELDQPRVTRRQREQARAAAPPVDDDRQAEFGGPLISGAVGSTYTTHRDDVTLARSLLRRRRPSRDEVRTAILWGEILGPPRALKPYRPPSRRGSGGGPSSIAIVPLRDRPKG